MQARMGDLDKIKLFLSERNLARMRLSGQQGVTPPAVSEWGAKTDMRWFTNRDFPLTRISADPFIAGKVAYSMRRAI